MGGAAASPLAEIERAVQERAKDISLEMAAPGGEVKLRALIAGEVARWNDDHRRGRRAFALPDPELVVERAFRNLARYGPLTPLLADDDVWEVMVNAPHAVFVRRHRGPSGYHDEVFHDDDHVVRVLTKLLDDASSAHRSLDRGPDADPGRPGGPGGRRPAAPGGRIPAHGPRRGRGRRGARPRSTPRTSLSR